MKKSVLLGFIFGLAGAVPVLADHSDRATPQDLRQLQSEVARLDDSLSMVDENHSRAREFQRREDDIRQDLVRLRNQVRRHRQDDRQGLSASKDEVDAINRRIVDLRSDVESTLDSQGGDQERDQDRDLGDFSVPDGTEIQIRLAESVSSRTARVEDRVTATVAQSVRANGRVVIPAGTEVQGTINLAEPARRPAHGGRIEMGFASLRLNGRPVSIDSRVVSVGEGGLTKKRAGLGALVGGVVGGLLGGKTGVVLGAVVGGTGAVVASQGKEVELPAGTMLTLRLDRAVGMVR